MSLTPKTTLHLWLCFSSIRDGQHIAYNQEYEGNLDVCIIHTDGPPINLTGWPGAEGSPSWSPDGTRIAFSSDGDGDHEIYLMNADGTGLVNLAHNPPGRLTRPKSPLPVPVFNARIPPPWLRRYAGEII